MTHAQAVATHAAERYLLDEMPELERYTFEAHFFDCDECAESVRTGALMREGVAAGLMPAASAAPAHCTLPPSHPLPRGWRAGLPWAVAALLALTVGYQSLWVVPGLREQGVGMQALAPVTLAVGHARRRDDHHPSHFRRHHLRDRRERRPRRYPSGV